MAKSAEIIGLGIAALGAFLLFRKDPATGESALGGLLGGGGSGGGQSADLGDSSSSFPAFDANGDGVVDDRDRSAIYTPGLGDSGGFGGSGSPVADQKAPGFFAGLTDPYNLGAGAAFLGLAGAGSLAGRAAGSLFGRGAAQTAAPVVESAAARATLARTAAPIVTRAATAGAGTFVAAGALGATLGELGVVGLQKAGVTPAIAHVAQRAPVSTAAREGILAATFPVQYVGAVAQGIADPNRSVGQNVREVAQAQANTGRRVLRNASVSNFAAGTRRIGAFIWRH